MDDFPGLLARDFGFKPQGKSAPMAPPRNNNSSSNSSSVFGLGSDFTKSSSLKSTSGGAAVFEDHDRGEGLLFNDVFGGPPKYSSTSAVDSRGGGAAFDYESIFKDQSSSSNAASKSQNPKSNSMPVYDKPVYDDDIFEGLPGLKNSSTPHSSASATAAASKFDNVFASISESPPRPQSRSAREGSPFDDLLGNLGRNETTESRAKPEKDASVFDDLLPGFGRSSSPSSSRSNSQSNRSQTPPSNLTKTSSNVMDDPFVVLESTSTPVGSTSGVFPDPLEEIGNLGGSRSSRVNGSSISGGVFDDLDPLESLGKSVPPVSTDVNKREKDRSPLRTAGMGSTQSHHSKESTGRPPVEDSEGLSRKRTPVGSFSESHENPFDIPSVSTDSRRSVNRATSPPSYMNASPSEASQVNTTPKSEEVFESSDDVWLTVSEIPLFTEPTSAPPPSRPPPPRPTRVSRSEAGSFPSTNARRKVNEFSSVSNSNQYSHSPRSARAAARSSAASQMDELEDFAMGRTWNNVNEFADVPSGEDVDSSVAAAAAMKEAMDRAEAKFRHAKEMRERESLKAARNKESVQLDRDERGMQDSQERELRERQERQQRERDEEEKEQRRLEREREREEKEREQRRLEKEREQAREVEERGKARQAVERATREARERAAAEARLRAERAAVGKANAAARERAERAAVQRAQAEARERAAAEARERAEKAAAEARERANAEARERANAEARDRAAALARAEADVRLRAERAAVERAAKEARERAAAAARASHNQPKNDNDLESFFSMGSRPSSAPRPRASSSDPFDNQSKGGPEVTRRTSVGASSNMKKASSTTNIVDDLSSIFGASASQAGEFQDVEGETEERRRARLERHQRTQERAAKALAEKNQRDLQAQRDQAERHRIAETLDVEIKRWAAGKEGNLRALLATLQYVLWPECGWQPVSLTDLITAAAVKKVYRKATLCIHPDKVQQKGANLQQKYIAEKVFDLLKEAWNKFNSEELF